MRYRNILIQVLAHHSHLSSFAVYVNYTVCNVELLIVICCHIYLQEEPLELILHAYDLPPISLNLIKTNKICLLENCRKMRVIAYKSR